VLRGQKGLVRFFFKQYGTNRKVGLESEQIQRKASVERALRMLEKVVQVNEERRKVKMLLIDTLL